MATDKMTYPSFFEGRAGDVYAYLTKDKVFHLKLGGHGKGHGFEFRLYKTRRTAIAHRGLCVRQLTYHQWVMAVQDVLAVHILEVQAFLPKELTTAAAPRELSGMQKLLKVE